MRRGWWVALALCLGCGGSAPKLGQLPGPKCPEEQYFDGHRCHQSDRARASLDAGAQALAAFQVDVALSHLQKARMQGPLAHADLVRLHEQLGIAYSYLGEEKAAVAAFDTLLSLDPGHLLPYTLSPKATFVFERARRQARTRSEPTIDVNWPRKLTVEDPVAIGVEVVSDPKSFLARAVVHVRRAGDSRFGQLPVNLANNGDRRVLLPPIGGNSSQTIELFVNAFDQSGNEVLQWSSPLHPREIQLGYQRPQPWYGKWWVLTLAGTAAAAIAGTTVLILTQDAPDTVPGRADIK